MKKIIPLFCLICFGFSANSQNENYQIQVLQRTVDSLNTLVYSNNSVISSYEKQLKAKDLQIKSLETRISNLARTIDSLKQNISKMNLQNKSNPPNVNNLRKYIGTYKIPYNEFYSDGELVFKVVDSKLKGECKRYIYPMAGYFIEKYEISDLNNEGGGKYFCTHEEYNNSNELQAGESENSSGYIYFFNNRVKIGNNVYYRTK